ncbi:MAG: GNAT family N-acetyltransferase [Planctomycetales bacterium]
MGVTYYKRFRMELELDQAALAEPVLPAGFQFLPWQPALLQRHAAAKYESFRDEVDSDLFPCLAHLSGCLNLMSDIVQRATFVPQATWLIAAPPGGPLEDCGTIQGVVGGGGWGAVQNVGVAPAFRGLGLGRALILRLLHGFREARVPRVYLEVTARNTPAVALYRSVGFRLARTTYKAAEQPTPQFAVL